MDKMIKNNNKGFSLVELIVVVLITGILMLAVGIFVSTSRTAFQVVNTSASLQEESMTVERVVSEALMEAINYGYATETISGHESYILIIEALKNNNGSYAADNKCLHFFVCDKADKQLRYCYSEDVTMVEEKDNGLLGFSVVPGGGGASGVSFIENQCFSNANKKYSLVAKYVTDFKVKDVKCPTPDKSGELVRVECEFNFLDKTYVSHIASVTRNKE